MIEFCCNAGNIDGNNRYIGGICGHIDNRTIIRDCYFSSLAEIKYNDNLIVNDIGNNTNNHVGRLIGLTNITDFENCGILNDTIYYVVNGNSNEESQYWLSSNLDEPKLLWEN